MNKQYLGDAVYAEIEPGLGLLLTTEDGLRVTNRIHLELEVCAALLKYLSTVERILKGIDKHA